MKAEHVTICQVNPDYVVGFVPGLAVAFWRQHTRPEYVQQLEAVARQAYKASKQPIGLVQIAPVTAIAPDARARTALVRMLRALDGTVGCSALVHETEGFRAALIRSIVTGLAALSSPGYPHRVFTTVGEAAAWMGNHQQALIPARVRCVVAEVREAASPTKSAGWAQRR